MVDDKSGSAKGKIINNFVPSSATIDFYVAPDSTAKRPDAERLADRPRVSGQTFDTALEADLVQNQPNPRISK